MSLGTALALLGAALAMVLAAVGSSIGVVKIGVASSGLLTKEPKLFSKLLILMLLPSSQSIYALTVAFMMFVNLGILPGADLVAICTSSGIALLFLCLPVGVIGLVSTIVQGNAGVAAVSLFGKQSKAFGNCILIISGSEVFALFGFLISMLGVMFLDVTLISEAYYDACQTVSTMIPQIAAACACHIPPALSAIHVC